MTDVREHRQLLAIMFTDVVGYTALTERDEAAAVRVRTQHRDLVRTLVEQFDGEVVNSTGDESLSIFPSALRAVDCALALQGALRSYPDMRLRIGLHLGDVIRRNGEVVGEGVNVAARIRPRIATIVVLDPASGDTHSVLRVSSPKSEQRIEAIETRIHRGVCGYTGGGRRVVPEPAGLLACASRPPNDGGRAARRLTDVDHYRDGQSVLRGVRDGQGLGGLQRLLCAECEFRLAS